MKLIEPFFVLAIALAAFPAAGHPVYRLYSIPQPAGYIDCSPQSINTQRSVLFSCYQGASIYEAVLSTTSSTTPVVPPPGFVFTAIGLDNRNQVFGNLWQYSSSAQQAVIWSSLGGVPQFRPAGGNAPLRAVSSNGTMLYQAASPRPCSDFGTLTVYETAVKVGTKSRFLDHSSNCAYVVAQRVNNKGVVAGNDGSSANRDIAYTAVIAAPTAVYHPELLPGLSNGLDINDELTMVGSTSLFPGIGGFGWLYSYKRDSVWTWSSFSPTRISKDGIGYNPYGTEVFFSETEELVQIETAIVGKFDPNLVFRGVVEVSDKGEMLVRATHAQTLQSTTLLLVPAVPSGLVLRK